MTVAVKSDTVLVSIDKSETVIFMIRRAGSSNSVAIGSMASAIATRCC
jgi:hypothetical protein